MSGQLKVLFMKEAESQVLLVTWPKLTCDVGEFLQHCDKGDRPV